MQNKYFESTPDTYSHSTRFLTGGPIGDGRLEPDDFLPQLQLTLHGPNELVAITTIRFETDAPAHGAALRLLMRPGLAKGAMAYGLPLAQLTTSTAVALSVAGLAPGRYALWADALRNFSATAVWLVDAHAGVRINMRQEPVYIFSAVAAAPGRFWLHLIPVATAEGPVGGANQLRGLAAPGWAQA